MAAGRAILWARAALCAAALIAGPAMADVLEIGSDGAVQHRTGAGTVRWSGGAITPLQDDADDGPAPILPAAALTNITAPSLPAAYAPTVDALARRFDLSPRLIAALVWQESRWRANAVSSKGAVGLAQLMPATARALGVNPADPHGNLEGCARYLRTLLDTFDGDVERALAAYDAGPARVLKAGGIPGIAETRGYVTAIVDHLSAPDKTGD